MQTRLLGSASFLTAGLLATAMFAGCAMGDGPADLSRGGDATEAPSDSARLPSGSASGADAGKTPRARKAV